MIDKTVKQLYGVTLSSVGRVDPENSAWASKSGFTLVVILILHNPTTTTTTLIDNDNDPVRVCHSSHIPPTECEAFTYCLTHY